MKISTSVIGANVVNDDYHSFPQGMEGKYKSTDFLTPGVEMEQSRFGVLEICIALFVSNCFSDFDSS
jgi:hypothetical protein